MLPPAGRDRIDGNGEDGGLMQRYIPYGYRICDGQLCVNSAEAGAVVEVFRFYLAGRSYKSIAEGLNQSKHPPYGENGWNKHHVKRILENRRYLGADGCPAIIAAEQFTAARAIHDEMAIPNAPLGVPPDALWKRLQCGECGGRLVRNIYPRLAKGSVHLWCEGCGFKTVASLAELHSAVLALMNRLADDVRLHSCGQYGQTPTTLRLANAIARGIAHPVDSEEAARLILEGVSARYAGIAEPPRLPPQLQYGAYGNENHLSGLDWSLFREVVSHISLGHTGLGLTTLSGYSIFLEGEIETKCKAL